MENINKFIGIPYKFNGRSFSGCDCLGLVWLFYHEHGWINIDDGEPIDDKWMQRAAIRIMKWFPKNMKHIKNSKALEFGDIIVSVINGNLHFGIYLEYGKVLSTQLTAEEKDCKSTIYPRMWWDNERCFKGGFRRL